MSKVSIVIPARNEIYLQKTVDDLLTKARGEVQIIVSLDGYWPKPILKNDQRLILIHRTKPVGMRGGINSAVAISKGEYVMKCDAHCSFDEGYDVKLASDCKDNWVVVPRRYSLDAESWTLKNKPPIDYMYLSKDLHGVVWDYKSDKQIDDLMSSQGSCWFMKRAYFDYLELMDEATYGTFWNEFQEIGLKCWLSGGNVKVNKKTWYAHWHKPKEVGRGYSLGGEKGITNIPHWHKYVHDINWLVNKFAPVPTWN